MRNYLLDSVGLAAHGFCTISNGSDDSAGGGGGAAGIFTRKSADSGEAKLDDAGTASGKPPESGDLGKLNEKKVEEKKDSVSEAEPDVAPAFGKHGGQDENDVLTQESEIDAIEKGAAAQSAQSAGRQAGIDSLVAADLAELDPDDDSVRYTSHPISNFRFGKYQFEKGILTLKPDEAAAFEELLSKASDRTKGRVRKIDPGKAAAIGRSFLESRRTRGVDTSRPGPSGGTA